MSCEEEYDLEKSVLIYDKDYNDLPAYSEWGYNTFGAYYDRKVFISNNYEIPLKVISYDNSTTFIFKGEINNPADNSYNSYYNEEMSMKLSIENFKLETYNDLLLFNDTTIDLSHPDCSIVITIDNDIFETVIISGEFEFKKVQNLTVDNEPVEIIMSGLFDYQFLLNEEPISVSNGRFDIGIGDENFYKY